MSASEPVTFNVPADTDVAPVYVFTPESVVVPLPVLAKSPAPAITPETSVLVLGLLIKDKLSSAQWS